VFKKHGEGEDAKQDRHNGDRLYHGIGSSQLLLAGEFLDVAVLCRRVEGTLHRQQKGHGEGKPEPAKVVGEGDQQSQNDGNSCTDFHDQRLAVFVGEITGGGEQQYERQQYQAIHDGRQDDLGLSVIDLEDRILDQDLVSQIDKGVQKNNQDEGDESRYFEQFIHVE